MIDAKEILGKKEFKHALDIYTLDDIRDALSELHNSLLLQIIQHKDAGDKDWRKRANYLKQLVANRLGTVNAMIKEDNREQTASLNAVSSKWGALCLDLARELSIVAPEILDDLRIPGGEITVREWMDLRIAQKAAKV